MIIDSYAHLGHDYVFDVTLKEEELVVACDKFRELGRALNEKR